MPDAVTTDYALVPGAGGQGWYWHLVLAELARRGHRAVAVDLPGADPVSLFLHDVAAPLVEVMRANREGADESSVIFGQPWPLAAWPPVPTEVLSGRDGRFFPLFLQQRVARERLGLAVKEIPGGHLAALSQPAALADQIVGAGTDDQCVTVHVR